MSLSVVYRGPKGRGAIWREIALNTIPDLSWSVWPDVPEPEKVDALVTWLAPDNYQQIFPNLSAIFSVGAGVDQFSPQTMPTHIKLVKMVDPGINAMMISYVLSSVLMLHRDQLAYLQAKSQSTWAPLPVKLPSECRVGIMGLGNLGQSVAKTLMQLGFKLSGWNKSSRTIDGVQCYFAQSQLAEFMSQLDIVICLLPLTPETKGILNAHNLAHLPKGASVINVGRGQHLVEQDLINLLDTGHIKQAILDVFEQEPLPAEHPFWQHPAIHITPHIAAVTRNDTAGQQLADNFKRWLSDEPLVGEIDKQKGY